MPDRPNVLFLLSDEHSYRYLGHRDDESGEPVDTPTMDDLAANGTSFDTTYCPIPLCTPSRHCILTGRNVQNAGAWSNGQMLQPGQTTLPEAFGGAGYATSLVGKMHLGGDHQFVGFDDRPYGDHQGMNGHQYEPVSPERRSADGWSDEDVGVTEYPESQLQEFNVVRETMAWLREQRHENPDQPWFLCASFSRPHTPFTAPPRYIERYLDEVPPPKIGHEGDTTNHPLTESMYTERSEETNMRARAAYFACVQYMDEILGDLLAMLDRAGFLEDTIVVYTSDHGTNAGEHGLWGKKTWHEGSARVPLIFQLPEHREGELEAAHLDTPVNLIDLYPTLCSLSGVEIPPGRDGVDLSEAIRTGAEPDRGPVFCDNFIPNLADGTQYRMVRDGRYKYVRFADAPELFFDLETDPLESTNLAPNPGEHADALDRLRGIVDDTLDFDAMEERRDRELQELAGHGTGVARGTAGNSYLLRDGRIIDADSVITKPDVLIQKPSKVFADFPDDE